MPIMGGAGAETVQPPEWSYLSSGKGIPGAGSEDIKVLLPVLTERVQKAVQF